MASPELPARYKDPAGSLPLVLGLFRDINTLAVNDHGGPLDAVRFGSYDPGVYVKPSPIHLEARLLDTGHMPWQKRFGKPDTYDLSIQGFGGSPSSRRTIESIGITMRPNNGAGFEAAIGDDMVVLPEDPTERAVVIEHLIGSFYIRYSIDALVREVEKRQR